MGELQGWGEQLPQCTNGYRIMSRGAPPLRQAQQFLRQLLNDGHGRLR